MASSSSTIVSAVVGLVGSIFSAYFFSIGAINFEGLVWIIIGLIFFLGIMIYQEIQRKLENQEWEQKRLDEKFKIYKRLKKIEGEILNAKKR